MNPKLILHFFIAFALIGLSACNLRMAASPAAGGLTLAATAAPTAFAPQVVIRNPIPTPTVTPSPSPALFTPTPSPISTDSFVPTLTSLRIVTENIGIISQPSNRFFPTATSPFLIYNPGHSQGNNPIRGLQWYATVQTVYNIIEIPAQTTSTLSVQCPPGGTISGGGYVAQTPNIAVLVSDQFAVSSWQVIAQNTMPASQNPGATTESLAVIADCISGSFPLSDQSEIQSVTVPEHSQGAVSVACSSGLLTGGGFYNNAGLQVLQNSTDGGSRWDLVAKNNSSSNQTLTAEAQCVTGLPAGATFQQWSVTGSLSAGTAGSTVVYCPANTLFTGSGFAGSSALSVYQTDGDINGMVNGSAVVASNSSTTSKLITSDAVCLSLPGAQVYP